MKHAHGDLWDYHARRFWVVIPTNAQATRERAHMGKGLAKQAADRFPELPRWYGERLDQQEPCVTYAAQRLLLVTTKTLWSRPSTLEIVADAARWLAQWAEVFPEAGAVTLPQLGCGLGGLDWEQVRPILEQHLNERFTVVTP